MIFVLLFAAVFVATVVVFVKRVQQIGALPRPPVAALAAPQPIGQLGDGGVVRVRGIVQPVTHPIYAPITGRACVAYAVIAKIDGSELVIATEQAGVKFGVHDPSGHALVQMDGTTITLAVDHVETCGHWNPPSARTQAFLEKYRGPGKLQTTLEIQEAILPIGVEVDVTGAAAREPDPQAARETGFRDEVATRLRFDSYPHRHTPNPDDETS